LTTPPQCQARRFLVGGSFFLVLLAMFAIFYFLLIRPQRQQQRKHAEMLTQLKVGDEVVTVGGIYGEVVQLDTERVMLEIDDDVRVAVARRAVTTVVPPEELDRLEADDEPAEPAEVEEGVMAEEPLTAEERSSR
jgi:preprotein translocase subunit YajC